MAAGRLDGVRYPGVSELAALQSAAFGVPADRHVEVTRTLPGPDGTRMPHSLLTEIAAYGRFPARAACTAARPPRKASSPAPGHRWSAA